MSIALVITAGFGNGTFNGAVGDVVTRGYTIGEEVPDVRMRGENRILIPSMSRSLIMPNANRSITMPARIKRTKL